MNKLVFTYLLSLMILYIQSKSCTELTPVDGECTDADLTVAKGYQCKADGTSCKLKSDCELSSDCKPTNIPSGYKCEKGSDSKCKLVSTATNSSDILNIFKITFTLLIVFTIL